MQYRKKSMITKCNLYGYSICLLVLFHYTKSLCHFKKLRKELSYSNINMI